MHRHVECDICQDELEDPCLLVTDVERCETYHVHLRCAHKLVLDLQERLEEEGQ